MSKRKKITDVKSGKEVISPLDTLVMQLGHGKKYEIIYADPPWRYNGNECLAKTSLLNGRIDKKYKTMSLGELKVLPVKNIAANKSLIFLWVVSPMLDDGIELMKEWGFEYGTVAFIWYKHFTNPGHYTLSECELCLVGRKGGIPSPRGDRNIKQFVSEKRKMHSAKPFEVRRRIEKMFPTQSKIELFARDKTELFKGYGFEGWELWGNEVPQSA